MKSGKTILKIAFKNAVIITQSQRVLLLDMKLYIAIEINKDQVTNKAHF